MVVRDRPGAPETVLGEINEWGQITGSASDVVGGLNVAPRNFVLDDAAYTAIEPPGASLTVIDDINNRGEIVGLFYDAGGTGHGFLRDRSGRYTTIDHPDAASPGSAAGGINDRRQIVGEYFDAVTADVLALRQP